LKNAAMDRRILILAIADDRKLDMQPRKQLSMAKSFVAAS
jgi:hypothetical protein